MAGMVKSGIPLVRALTFLERESSNPTVKAVATGLVSAIREGQGIHAAFGRYPSIFSAFDRGMLQAGETGGKIEEALVRIAQYHSSRELIRGKIKTALAYPIFIVVVGIASMVFMLTNIIPQFSTFFANLGQNLPLPTRMLIAMSEGLQKYWWILLLVAGGGVFFVQNAFKDPKNKAAWDTWVLKLPWIGDLILKSEVSNLSRSLALLIRSGIPILGAIRAAIPVISSQALRTELEKVYKNLEQGGYLSKGFEGTKLFPPFFIQIMSVGEESGRLDEALSEAAEWYELETAEVIQIFMSLLEPAMILVVGIILGLMMMSVLLPIFSMSAIIN